MIDPPAGGAAPRAAAAPITRGGLGQTAAAAEGLSRRPPPHPKGTTSRPQPSPRFIPVASTRLWKRRRTHSGMEEPSRKASLPPTATPSALPAAAAEAKSPLAETAVSVSTRAAPSASRPPLAHPASEVPPPRTASTPSAAALGAAFASPRTGAPLASLPPPRTRPRTQRARTRSQLVLRACGRCCRPSEQTCVWVTSQGHAVGAEAACGWTSLTVITSIASITYIVLTNAMIFVDALMDKNRNTQVDPYADRLDFGALALGAAATPRRYRPSARVTKEEGAWLTGTATPRWALLHWVCRHFIDATEAERNVV